MSELRRGREEAEGGGRSSGSTAPADQPPSGPPVLLQRPSPSFPPEELKCHFGISKKLLTSGYFPC